MRVAGIVGAVLLAAGAVAVALGILPAAGALAVWNRAWPVLLFVAAMSVVAALAAAAGVFTVVGGVIAGWGRGRAWMLWLWLAAAALVCTVFLSLDTTAVLLTPVVAATVRRARLDPAPFLITTVWMANAGSLLLPVSNLTNLLAQHALGGISPSAFAAMMAGPAAAGAIVPLAVAGVAHRATLAARYRVAVPGLGPEDPALFRTAAIVVAVLIPLLVSGLPVWLPACAAAATLSGVFLARRRAVVRIGIVPWRLLLFAGGLLLAVAALQEVGMPALLGAAAGTGHGTLELLHVAAVGGAGANAVNNLPAYLALEPVAGTPARIAALLIGVNAGALITPWASLATLLWHRQAAGDGIRIPWARYTLLGCVAAPLTVIAAVLLL